MELKRSLCSMLICFSGCFWQIINISSSFFTYRTSTLVSISIVEELAPPAISVCWLRQESLQYNSDGYEPKFGVHRDDMENVSLLLEKLTVREIFNISLSDDSIFTEKDACAIKKPSNFIWRYPLYSKDECLTMVSIQRFIHRSYMCYQITPIQDVNDTFTVGDVSYAPDHPNVLRMYYLNDAFIKNTLMGIYVHSGESSDLFDSIFSVEELIDFNATNEIAIIFSPTSQYRLPPPYDTMCDYAPNGFNTFTEYLYSELNNLTTDELNLVHTFGFVYNDYDYPILTTDRLKNRSIHDAFMALNRRLDRRTIKNCKLVYNVPSTIRQTRDRLSITINWPQNSATTVKSIAVQGTMDYIIYVTSTVGIWFGCSALSILSPIESCISQFITASKESVAPTLRKLSYTALRSEICQMRACIKTLNHDRLKWNGQISEILSMLDDFRNDSPQYHLSSH